MGILLSIIRFFTPSWLDNSINRGNERERQREKLRQRIKSLERERSRLHRIERIKDKEERGDKFSHSDTDSESDSSYHSLHSMDSKHSGNSGRSRRRRDKDSIPDSRRERRRDDRNRSKIKSRIFEDSRLNRSENMSRSERHPDKFDGIKIDLKDWLIHFQACADYNGWTYEDMGLNIAMALKGNAQQILGDLPYELRQNYDAIKDALQRRFDPKERKTWRKNELRSRKKGRNETIEEYGFAISRLTASAYPEMRREDRESVALEQFVDGLPSLNLKRHVHHNHPETIFQAIALASEFESFDSRYERRRPEDNEFQREVRNVRNTNKGVEEQTVKVKKDENKDKEEIFTKLLEAVTVLTKELIENKQTSEKRQEPRNQGQERRCFICGDPSHLAPVCPDKRRSDRMQDNRTPLNRQGPRRS